MRRKVLVAVFLILIIVAVFLFLKSNKTGNQAVANEGFVTSFQEAVGAMGQFRYAEAYAAFDKLLIQDPNNDDLTVNTAIARLNIAGDGDLVKALELLNNVLKRNPDHLRASYCAGLIESYLGPPANPTPHFRKVVQAAHDDADAAYLHAKSLEQDDLSDQAKAEYERCLKLNPYYASAILGLSRIARIEGDLEQANELIADFEKMKANPNGRVFEFAYRRMGKLGEVVPLIAEPKPTTLPGGPLFEKGVMLGDFNFADDLKDQTDSPNLVVADIDGNGRLDLVIGFQSRLRCLLDIDRENPKQVDFPWLKSTRVNSISFGHIDENGALDVFLARAGGNELWLQDDSGNWSKSENPALASTKYNCKSCRMLDSDHDGDLDFFCVNADGPIQLLINNRNGSFRNQDLAGKMQGTLMGFNAATFGDLDNHRDTDVLFTSDDNRALLLWNDRLWNYRAEDLSVVLGDSPIQGAVCVDFDHDGRLDLLVRKNSSVQVWSWANSEWKRFREFDLKESKGGNFFVVDLDGDGNLEIVTQGRQGNQSWLATDSTGVSRPFEIANENRKFLSWTLAAIHPEKGLSILALDDTGSLLVANPGTGRFPFAALNFSGTDNKAESIRSNQSGIGTRWKAQIGTDWTVGQVFPKDSSPSQSLQPELVGMRGRSIIDFVAVDWTDGVFQAELGIKSGQPIKIAETQRQLASCPVVYAWNGERIEFVTDVLGVGGIGFLTKPGEYAPPRPWENLMLTNAQLKPKDDRFIIKVGEPMEEACYLQSARLVSVSLPQGWDFVVDERMGITDPMPTGEIRYFRRRFPVVSASSSIEADVLDRLNDTDKKAPDVGDLDHRFIGLLKNEYWIQFEFGQLPKPVGKYALLIDGWVEYPYSQVVFGAWQAGRSYDPPTLEVREKGGDWKAAWLQFGYPAGMPRRILLPIPDSIKSDSVDANLEFRIRTNMQVYWDQISLIEMEECAEARIQEHSLRRAEVRHVGFPERTTGPQFVPHYDYGNRKGTWDARHLPGFYTRKGEVTELFSDPAPALTIFGPGEEVHFEFDVGQLPPGDLQVGGYVLQLKGWCKDMDLYTNHGNILEPVPRPDIGIKPDVELRYNSRYESGPWYSYGK